MLKEISYPIRLEDCPIVESTVELVCSFNIPNDVVLGVVYSRLKQEGKKIQIKNLPILQIPEAIRKSDVNLKNKPTHQLISSEGIILLGGNGISFGVSPKYQSWQSFRTFIMEYLSLIIETSIIRETSQLSVKYLNFFKGNIFDSINLSMDFNGTAINYPSTIFKSEIPSPPFVDLLQITNSVHIKNETLKLDDDGSLIDLTVLMKNVNIASLGDTIDKSHDKTCRYSDFTKVEPTSDISGRFSEITPISKVTNDEDIQVVSSFIESILCNSKPMDSELAELIDDNFWNLV